MADNGQSRISCAEASGRKGRGGLRSATVQQSATIPAQLPESIVRLVWSQLMSLDLTQWSPELAVVAQVLEEGVTFGDDLSHVSDARLLPVRGLAVGGTPRTR